MEKSGLYNKEGVELTIDEVIQSLPFVTQLSKVNRVEVIDETGRAYTSYKEVPTTEISFQDNCRTLKVFIY